jgi:type II secretory pathway pseudopilin PulG
METDQPESPGSVARQEIARQSVILVFGIAGAAVMVWIQHQQRTATADDWALLRMRAAKQAERLAATGAGRLWAVAERARLVYERERA